MAIPPHRPQDDAPRISEEDLRVIQHGPALRRYFMKKVNAAEAEDLVQDVFLSMQLRGSAGAIDNIEGYLFRVAANVLARRSRRRSWDWSRPDPLNEDTEPHDEVSPERTLIGKEEIARVFVALEGLPRRCSEAFILHRFEEMTYDAIARRMGVSRKAVGKLLQRAVRRLTQALGETP